jgi:hypothetical protein
VRQPHSKAIVRPRSAGLFPGLCSRVNSIAATAGTASPRPPGCRRECFRRPPGREPATASATARLDNRSRTILIVAKHSSGIAGAHDHLVAEAMASYEALQIRKRSPANARFPRVPRRLSGLGVIRAGRKAEQPRRRGSTKHSHLSPRRRCDVRESRCLFFRQPFVRRSAASWRAFAFCSRVIAPG